MVEISLEKWSQKTLQEIYKVLRSNKEGLSSKEADNRLRNFGRNEVKGRNPLIIYIERIFNLLKGPMTLILLISGIVALLIGAYADAVIIFITYAINIIISFLQEDKVSKAFEKLKRHHTSFSSVKRDGVIKKIPTEELVPGDIIIFNTGEKIPADARLITEGELSADESLLTGEWAPVRKNKVTLANEVEPSDQINILWKGTNIVNGSGEGIVIETGKGTFVGKIEASLSKGGAPTPLQNQVRSLAKMIMILVIVSSLIIAVIGYLKSYPLSEILLTSISIAIAGIPSGLAAAMTIVLAVGIGSILKKNGLVRNLFAAETLGAVTWILTDKTGTLTEGKMRLDELITFSGREKVDDNMTQEGRTIIEAAFLTTDGLIRKIRGKKEYIGTLIGKSIAKAADSLDFVKERPVNFQKVLKSFQFTSQKSYTSSIISLPNGINRYFIIGASEKILDKISYVRKNGKDISISISEKEKIKKILNAETENGNVVITIASSNVDNNFDFENKSDSEVDEKYTSNNLTFIGFLSFNDPIRKDIKESINFIKTANVKVAMVTGDSSNTALHVAKESGLSTDPNPKVIEGSQFKTMTDEQIWTETETVRIFSRMNPSQKLRLLNILIKKDEYVAMTGDGVNDAPALYQASIGIAVSSGTDTAKESSDLILLKDSFKTITNTIIEGRRIITNLKKILVYLISTSFSEVVLIGGALILSLPLPLTPAQILWANIVEEAFVSFAYAFEKGDPDAHKKNPRRKENRNILSADVKKTIFAIAISTGFFLLVLYLLLSTFTNATIEEIRTIVFVAISIDSILFALSLKRLNKSVFKINLFDNLYLIFAMIISISLLVVALLFEPLREILSISKIPTWGYLIFPISLLFHITIIEVIKLYFFKKGYSTRV